MERKPIWERKPEEIKQQDIATDRLAQFGGVAIKANNAEDEMITDFILSRSPHWEKSADGQWLYNPVDHKAEYLGQ